MAKKDYIDTYYEGKKARNLMFTENLLGKDSGKACAMPEGISWWSKELGRYRTAKEQQEFVDKMINMGKVGLGK
jgi:hypothetical protein